MTARTPQEDLRWDVELADGDLHDVGATRCEITGGALVFYDDNDTMLLAYSAHRWATVNAQ